MESRKMVLNNLLQGNNGEADIENRFMDMGREEERVRCMEKRKKYCKTHSPKYRIYFLNHAYRFISQKMGKQQYGEVLSYI